MTLVSTAARSSGSGSSLLFYTEFTSNVTVSAASEGTAQDVVSSGAQTYLGTAVLIEFQCEAVAPVTFASTPDVFFLLQDGATVLGRLTYVTPGSGVQASTPIRVSRRLTPSAGSHTYKVTAYRTTGQNYLAQADVGGSAKLLPGYIRISSDS